MAAPTSTATGRRSSATATTIAVGARMTGMIAETITTAATMETIVPTIAIPIPASAA
jgi:hypothetical protein